MLEGSEGELGTHPQSPGWPNVGHNLNLGFVMIIAMIVIMIVIMIVVMIIAMNVVMIVAMNVDFHFNQKPRLSPGSTNGLQNRPLARVPATFVIVNLSSLYHVFYPFHILKNTFKGVFSCIKCFIVPNSPWAVH